MKSELQYPHFKDYSYGRVYSYGYLKIEGPYSDLFLYGFLTLHKSSNRRIVRLYNPITKKNLLIQYSKYIYTVYYNKFIPDGVEVDHIDNDFTNDDINNLQLLTRKENYEKYRKHYTEYIQKNYYIELICNNCKKQFSKQKKRVEKENFANQYCCKQCETEYRNKDKIELNCATCKRLFLINRQTHIHNKSRNQQNFWCSDNCRLKFKERNLFNFISKDYFEYLLLNIGLENIAKYFNVNKSTIRDWRIKLNISSDILTIQRPNKLKQLNYLSLNKDIKSITNEILLNLLNKNYLLSDISSYFKIDKNNIYNLAISYMNPNNIIYNAKLINAFLLEGYTITEVANKLDVENISVKLSIQKYNLQSTGEKIRPPLLELREMFINGVSFKLIAELFGVDVKEVLKWLNRGPQAIVK